MKVVYAGALSILIVQYSELAGLDLGSTVQLS